MLYPDFDELVSLKNRKRTLKHASHRAVKSTISGNHHSPFRGQGLEFDAVREYVPGDDIRNIDWRVTARTGSPHLKLFKEERERQVIICIDMNSGMRFGTRNTFKSIQAARAAAMLGWQGLAQHDSVSACLYGDVPTGIQYFPPKRSSQSFSQMLKLLSATVREQHDISMHDAIRHISQASPTGALIYLISDFLHLDDDFSTTASFSSLNKKSDLVFISINDLADASIMPIGTLGIRSLKGEKNYINTDSKAGREAYALQWQKNRQLLNTITSKYKIPLIELSTESDISRDLIFGLKSIAKRRPR